jgi:hypothetical protein
VPLLKGAHDIQVAAPNFPFWVWHRHSFAILLFPFRFIGQNRVKVSGSGCFGKSGGPGSWRLSPWKLYPRAMIAIKLYNELVKSPEDRLALQKEIPSLIAARDKALRPQNGVLRIV